MRPQLWLRPTMPVALLMLLIGTAAAQPTKFHEAPTLAEQVKVGKLPPVDKRLPADPLVVPVVERAGQYGGVWRRAFLGPADSNNYVRVVYDALVRFSPDGAKIEPKIAAGWESSKDFRVWTIKLRQGARWSDGAPFTADDIVFWYQDVLLNKDLVPAIPSWMRNSDGTTATVEKVSPTAVRWTYKQPNTLLLTALANQDGGDRTYAVFLPAHYLKKFHPTYAKKEDVDKLVAAAGFKTWTELFAARNAPPENPERPTMAAWAPATRVSDQVFTLKRNPYFVGVDPSGNQLPYLDEVRFTFFADIQALNLAAIAGEFDMQERHIQMTNYPVFKETEKTGKYRVITWPTSAGPTRSSCSTRPTRPTPSSASSWPPRSSASRSRRPSTATRSRSRCSSGWASPGRACRPRAIPISRAISTRRSTRNTSPTRPTSSWTSSGSPGATPKGSGSCRPASGSCWSSRWCRPSPPGPTSPSSSPRTGRRSA